MTPETHATQIDDLLDAFQRVCEDVTVAYERGSAGRAKYEKERASLRNDLRARLLSSNPPTPAPGGSEMNNAGRELDAMIAQKVFGMTCGHIAEKVPLDELIRRERADFLAQYGQEAPPTWEGSARYDFEEADYPPKRCKLCHAERPWPQALGYSTVIHAAWLIVEKMRADRFDFGVDSLGDVGYRAWFSNEELRHFYGEGETAPLAICLAAVKAMEPANV